MTHIYLRPYSVTHDAKRGGERYVNIWRSENGSLHASEKHWTRAMALKGAVQGRDSAFTLVYRVVVKFK